MLYIVILKYKYNTNYDELKMLFLNIIPFWRLICTSYAPYISILIQLYKLLITSLKNHSNGLNRCKMDGAWYTDWIAVIIWAVIHIWALPRNFNVLWDPFLFHLNSEQSYKSDASALTILNMQRSVITFRSHTVLHLKRRWLIFSLNK